LIDPETGEDFWADTNSEDFRKAFNRETNVKALERNQFFKTNRIDRVELSVDKPYILELIKFFRTRESRR
jgi:vacuolar-type H+-ATPase subunit C/Vma6